MLRWIRRALGMLLALALAATVLAWWLLRGSLPRLDGELALPGLQAPVAVRRDALGVVTIEAASAADAVRALGFVHAQECYFEMDLMRRAAAGELSALLGPVALRADRARRVHRMRARVEAALPAFAGDRADHLQAYAEGANAGLAALRVRPWPYLLLRQAPAPWQVADSALVGMAMYFDLQDAANTLELELWRLRRHLPPALYRLLAHDGSRWDAPLLGRVRGDAPLPGPGEVDLRALPAPEHNGGMEADDHGAPGSNNLAVAGALTADGRTIVANDMHLALRAPNLWFRVRLRYPDPRAPGGRVDVAGFSLPGLPAVIVGSNGHVAWGFTNSYADTADWFAVHPCPATGDAPAGCEPVQRHRELIGVAGGTPEVLEVEETRFGPILHPSRDGEPALALRWVAHLPGALDVGLADMALAGDLDAALAVAARAAIPAQNLVLGDRHGRIAWRITGPLPERADGCPPSLAEAGPALPPPDCTPWPISTALAPVLADPPGHRLWTANARTLDGAALATVGDGGYALGIRAWQIRERLLAQDHFDEAALLAMQLDDQARLLGDWWRLLQDEARRQPGSALARLAAVSDWDGHASIGSVAYRRVRDWRGAVHARIARGLAAPAAAALGGEFRLPALPQLEGVVRPLLAQRPPHLLPRGFASWEALLEDAARQVLEREGDGTPASWGRINTARICHPLAGALPGLPGRWLCMPAEPLPGDTTVPRVQQPAFGASQRMVVAPGHEDEGIVHMPGGQSGHPLSPFWGAGHDDWVHGRPTPFLPGPARHELRLHPAL